MREFTKCSHILFRNQIWICEEYYFPISYYLVALRFSKAGYPLIYELILHWLWEEKYFPIYDWLEFSNSSRNSRSQIYHVIFLPSGFGDRLLSEVKKLAPKDIKIRVSFLNNTLSLCNKRPKVQKFSVQYI